jgi:hypothetical protein
MPIGQERKNGFGIPRSAFRTQIITHPRAIETMLKMYVLINALPLPSRRGEGVSYEGERSPEQ